MAEHTGTVSFCPKCGERQLPDTQDWFGVAVRLKVVNEKLVAALEALADEQALFAAHLPPIYEQRLRDARAVLAKPKENTAHESRLQQRDLDEETL